MMFYKCVKSQNIDFFLLLSNFIDEWDRRADDRQSVYMEIRARYNSIEKPTVQKAVDFFILREYAYGGMFRLNSRGKFNVPFGYAYVDKDIRKKVDYLNSLPVLEKFENLELHNVDFQDFSKRFKFSKNDFMFVDPPYNCSFTKYNEHDFNVDDQKRLADYLMDFKGKFMLVTQYTDLIKKLYKSKKLNIHTYNKKYKFNIKGRFNRAAQHALITNYDTSI